MTQYQNDIAILGIGSYLPPSWSVKEAVLADGGDASDYDSWPNFCVAAPDDHPSTMGAAAVRRALADAGIDAKSLSLVLSVGGSRDYPPSWSLSTEIAALVSASPRCFGIDITVGCLGLLAGFEVVGGWLRSQGGPAAIVSSERWTDTVSKKDKRLSPLWAYSDGAAAAIVAFEQDSNPKYGVYRGSCFITESDYNARILMKYGGTRFRSAPPGEEPFLRAMGPQPKAEVIARYNNRFRTVVSNLKQRFGVTADRIVFNQLGPRFVADLADLTGVSLDRMIVTGPELGHVGPADVLIGLERLRARGELAGNVFAVGNTPYASGAALVTA